MWKWDMVFLFMWLTNQPGCDVCVTSQETNLGSTPHTEGYRNGIHEGSTATR